MSSLSSSTSDVTSLSIIDNAMAVYFQRLGKTNYKNNGFGELLNDPDLPIDNELGAYSLMNNAIDFPIPSYVNLTTEKQKKAFIFQLLQYCFKHGQCPTDQYIKNYLVQQIKGHETHKNSSSFSEHKNDGLIQEEGAVQITDIGEMEEIKEPGFDDGYEGSVGIDNNNNNNDYELILDSLIEIPLKQSICDWNSRANREYIYFVEVAELFAIHNINYRWIEKHTRRDFMILLKEELGIPMGASTKIWKRFQSFVFIEETSDDSDQYKQQFEQDPYSLLEIEENTMDDMVIINRFHP